MIESGYLSSVGSEVIITLQLTTSRRHASLHAFVRRFAPSNAATRQPGLRPVRSISVCKKIIPTPFRCGYYFLTGSYLSSQAASSQVLSTYKGLTTVFGMGTGGSP